MTSLASRKTRLSVESSDCVRERGKLREVVFELTPYVFRVRLKGMRQSYEVSPASIYNLAVMKFVSAQKAEKKAKRKSR